MYRYLVTTLCLFTTLTIAACGGSETPQPAEAPPSDSAAPIAPPSESPASVAPEASAEAEPEPAAAAEAVAESAEPPAAPAADATPATASVCELEVTVADLLEYSTTEIRTSQTCNEFTLTLTHTGQMPAATMGHNWVLVPEGTGQEIATAGISAGAENGYVPQDDRIIANTQLVGGGDSDTITFSVADLSGTYTFVCTFPGHWVAMRGQFIVE